MTEKPKLPIQQDPDYMTSYADGFYLKLDEHTNTVRLVFYKKELRIINHNQTSLPEDFVNNLMFEVRLPVSALNGLLDIADRFNKYREELGNEDVSTDRQVYDAFLRFSEAFTSGTFDTSDPSEHDKDLNARYFYYLSKREGSTSKGTDFEQQSQ